MDAIKELYRDTTASLKVWNRISDSFLTLKGLRHGCRFSLVLFDIYTYETLRIWKKKCGGIRMPIGNTTLYTIQYTDDQIVIA